VTVIWLRSHTVFTTTFRTYADGWGFDPAEVGTEVQLGHGARDPLVPVEHALQLAAASPNCRIFVDPDEGHHFFRSSLEQILTALVGVPGPLSADLLRAA
jgi:pimeloyl-ACP methyl ester carboxylesterase